MNWYMDVLKKYAVFDGRSRRQEFWMFFLFNFIINLILTFLGRFFGFFLFISVLYSLAILVPGIAVAIRRMHDIGKSGIWILIVLIPCVGWIWYLVLAATEGEPSANAYGPSPK